LSKLISKAWLAWTRANRSVDNAVRYANCFGGARGLLLYALCRILRSYRGRVVETRVAGTDIRLLVRLGTSDISVFNGIYCWREYDWDFRSPPRVIVDAGAYTGLSSVFFAMRYPESQIIAIEPSDSNFEVLVRNSERFKNIKPVHAALWAQSGWLTLADPGRGAWGLQVREKRDMIHDSNERIGDNASQLVRAITLSDVIRDYKIHRIDLLKLDIEGSEKEVFSDCDSWIEQVDSILMELHDRFKTGCSRSFFKAIDEFPIESWRGENVLVMRSGSPLRPSGVMEHQSIR
jgi:FkbM family methyltransferase